MKKIVICVFFIIILHTNVFAISNLKDISGNWAENEIKILIEESVVNGYNDNTFRPNNYININEFLKMVVEMADYKLVTEGNQWPDWYILTATKNMLIEEGQFENYSLPITRSEASKIIGNYINIEDINNNKNIFVDLKADERDVVLKLVKLKIINGYSDKTFRGNNFITRAEACKLILNAYNAKQELLKTRKSELTNNITNIKSNVNQEGNNDIQNQYEIRNNRIYIYDSGRYANLNGQSLNQEYINDKRVINILKTLVGEESYTELKFIPDKYIINSLNICYGKNLSLITNGEYIFEIKFYENSYYDVAQSKNEKNLISDASVRIKTGKMWDKHFESSNRASSSEKNLYKLQEVIGKFLSEDVKKDVIEYIIAKREEAKRIENQGTPKIAETVKIGKYTISTFCMTDNDLEIYMKI